jgi:hypothetical protein
VSLSWLPDLWLLLAVAGGAILFMALISPLDALSWWAGWRPRPSYEGSAAEPIAGAASAEAPTAATYYFAYLSGIGEASSTWHLPDEVEFVARLGAALPHAVVINDVFPYSVTKRTLGDQRGVGWLWRLVDHVRRHNPDALVGILVNVRNLFQVAVSADPRYGPFFHLGMAAALRDACTAHGYRIGSGQRVVLLGYSGGGQVSIGTAPYLAELLRAPILVISIGGVMASDPGVLRLEHLYHLHGAEDTVQRLGLCFIGRWPIVKGSDWNQARAQHRITFVGMGPVAHNGPKGYFGPERLPDGPSHLDQTVQTVVDLVRRQAPATTASLGETGRSTG